MFVLRFVSKTRQNARGHIFFVFLFLIALITKFYHQ